MSVWRRGLMRVGWYIVGERSAGGWCAGREVAGGTRIQLQGEYSTHAGDRDAGDLVHGSSGTTRTLCTHYSRPSLSSTVSLPGMAK